MISYTGSPKDYIWTRKFLWFGMAMAVPRRPGILYPYKQETEVAWVMWRFIWKKRNKLNGQWMYSLEDPNA